MTVYRILGGYTAVYSLKVINTLCLFVYDLL